MAWPFTQQLIHSQILQHHPKFDYKIEEAPEFDQGGQSYICKGTRLQTNRVCVLKTLKKPFIRYDKTFPIEIVALFKAQRIPGIIRLLSLYDHQDEFTIAMEYWGDCDLFTWYHTTENITEAHVQILWCQLVHIVKSLAEKGIYHRDIKFENVLINKTTGEIKLIDFGHAFINDGKTEHHTQFGSKIFWPPEFFYKQTYIPEAWAVWSLGIFLYEMAYGSVCSEGIKCYEELKCDKNRISLGCTELLKGCLKYDPASRIKLADIFNHRWFLHC